ncbi:hypothetical protein ACT29H_02760 [Thermophagus sp. OGC60D27]|uniref:hypothetical protein n=1 Tax=Thermophagus sp. OGC60D27 TaxID=3458415 RepID=UPI0040382EA3
MGKITNKIKFLSLLAMALLVFGCGDDDDNSIKVGELSSLQYSYSNGSVQVEWAAYEGAQSYQVFVDGGAVSSVPYTGTSAMLSDLQAQSVIGVEAYADAEATVLIAKSEITYEVSVVAPAAPSNVAAVAEATGVTLTFTYSGSCHAVNIYSEARTESSTPLVTIEDVAEGENAVTIGELTPETDYTLYLYAYNTEADVKAFSDEVTVNFTTESEIAELAVKGSGYNARYSGGLQLDVSVNVSELFEDESEWEEAGDLVLELYCADTEDGEFVVANTDEFLYLGWGWSTTVNITAWKNDMDFVDGNTYYLKGVLKTENGKIIGETAVEAVVFEEPETNAIIPGAPGNVKVEKNGDCVTISWDAADNAVSYTVKVSSSSSMSYASEVGKTSTNSMKDCDRGKNVKMYYQVTAVSSTGNKKSSSVVSIWL